ncbi:hypothetical protein OU994_18010 [Pseudoduganella sp. SL102]|uniref:hypothetical protein n=1 Tax=Pseudoduganella sp. SL102 TaxID=2995154 RepID=UPI00248B9384|nr:hypothetical protein [Pseudoduganella sp. SL102]WBS00216.1 hypothetical protein OU994_18010 [Pseudoduganella sp. SL102]
MSLETAGGAAAIKFFGVAVLTAAGATALGFLFMWPRTIREAFVRFASSIACSFTFGPLLAMAVHSHWPGLFTSARELGTLYGGDPLAGVLVAAAPFMVLAALPAWWLLGGLVRWLDKRRDKDLAEIATDAAAVVKTVREAL